MSKAKRFSFQNAGTLIALVISVIAMFTSIYEANIMKTQQKSMVWPYLSLGVSYSDTGFSIRVFNNGIGPALVKSVEVKVDGEPVETMLDMVNKLMPDNDSLGYNILRQQRIRNYVFKPGEEVEVIGFTWNQETRKLASLIDQKVHMRICYESVLGESWIYDVRSDTHEEGSFKAAVEYQN